jgi:RNA polymerase sigma-70 factor, ECF subfamily
VDDVDGLSDRFESHRSHLRSVAYRMLGSLSEADDAVQETWLRLARADTAAVQNLRAWLTTVVGRVCLDMLRARTARHEERLDVHVPDPILSPVHDDRRRGDDPEQHAVFADSVGLALLVVLDTLSPTERLAFVLHDVFAVPFEQIGRLLERSPAAAKQLASRARRRVQGATANATADPRRQHEIVHAFLTASQTGDFEGLLALLDPDVVLRADAGDGPLGPSRLIRGASAVIEQAQRFAPLARFAKPILVNGTPGLVSAPNGQVLALLSFTVSAGRISEIDILADPDRLRSLDVARFVD